MQYKPITCPTIQPSRTDCESHIIHHTLRKQVCGGIVQPILTADQ